MKGTYSNYIDTSTAALVSNLSSETICLDEKKALINAFSDNLIDKVGDPDSLEDWNLIFARETVIFIDKKITHLLSAPVTTQKDFTDASSLCNRQISNFKLFSEKRWPVPNIENKDLIKCLEEIEFKYDSQYIKSKIITLDETITSETSMAERTLSIDICDSVIIKIKELEEKINYCKEKGINIPKIKNGNIKNSKNNIESIKHQAEERNTLYTKMYEVDANIQRIGYHEPITNHDCVETISLCEQQAKNLLRCKEDHWTIPALRFGDTDSIVKKYNHLLSVLGMDQLISEKKESAQDSTRAFRQFSELCYTQNENLQICEKNHWTLPDLENSNPLVLCETVRKEKAQKDKIKNRKRNLIIILVTVLVFVFLSLFGYLRYIDGKIALPFGSSNVIGENYQDITDNLVKLGFTNIKAIADNSGFDTGGKILELSVGGSDFYWTGKHYDPDTAIEIQYSNPDRIDATSLFKNWTSMSYKDLEGSLKKAGFKNIKTDKTVTYEKNRKNLISSINIEGTKYTEGSCFIPKTASILITYYDFRIRVSYGSNGFNGQEANIVQKELSSQGFTNITLDSISTGFGKGGTVSSISINKSQDFKRNDVFAQNVPVIIYYYSTDRVYVSDALENWKEQKCADVQKKLRDLGLTTLTRAENTNSKSKIDKIYKITLDGTEYKSDEWYIPTTSKITIECYKVVFEIGKNASDIRKKDYKQIVAELKDIGFTYIRLERSDDLVTGWRNKPGTVKSISINGISDFKYNSKFASDSKIVIVVNTFKGKDYPDIIYTAK